MTFAWNPNERLSFDVRLEAIDEAIAEGRYDDAADELATMLEHGATVLARLRGAEAPEQNGTPRQVSVSQRMHTVEHGATVIGYQG